MKCAAPTDTNEVFGDLRFTYTIRNIESVTIDLIEPVSAMALPQAVAGDAANVLVKAEGNTMRFTVSWVLHDDDSSVVSSDGGTIDTSKYSNGSVDTADEQARFLIDELQSKGVEYKYWLGVNDGISRYGLIEKMSLQKAGSTPVTWKASLQFIAGDVVTIEN